MEQLRFDGRVAVVTGAGRGLGRAYAMLLASRGAQVVVNDIPGLRDNEVAAVSPADDVVAEIISAGGQAVASLDSVATPEGAAAIVKTALDTFGRIDIIIHNAGICDWTAFEDISYEHFQRMRQVHYDGPWLLTHAAWPHMKRQKYGRVLFITSHVGFGGTSDLAHYGSAKWASAGMARMLSFETGDADIKTNALGVLGYTRLFVDGFFSDDTGQEDMVEKQGERWWKRNVRSDQVAPVAAWMVHEKCHLNGAILDTGAGHTFRFIIATTPGYTNPNLTIEDVDQHMPDILDAKTTNAWESLDQALHYRLGTVQAAGVEPMDTVYTD